MRVNHQKSQLIVQFKSCYYKKTPGLAGGYTQVLVKTCFISGIPGFERG